MKAMVLGIAVCFSALAMSVFALPEGTMLKVEKSAFCISIRNREPIDAKSVFPSDVGKVYYWTDIYGAEQPTAVKHAWYYNNVKLGEISLDIRYPRNRTWSLKTIDPAETGDWSVEVVDESGNVLKKDTFKIISR